MPKFSTKARRNGNIALTAVFAAASMWMLSSPYRHTLSESDRELYARDAVEKELDEQLKPQIASLLNAKAPAKAPANDTIELHAAFKAADIQQAVKEEYKASKTFKVELGLLLAAYSLKPGRRAWRLNKELKGGPELAP